LECVGWVKELVQKSDGNNLIEGLYWARVEYEVKLVCAPIEEE